MPEVVIGDPPTVNPVGAVRATEVTVPSVLETQVPLIAKQPSSRLIPCPYNVDVAVVKLAILLILNREPGEVVPMPIFPPAPILNLSVYVDKLSSYSPNASDPRVEEAYMCFKLDPPDESVKINCGAVPALSICNVAAGVVVPIPTLVASSYSTPVPIVFASVHLAT